MEYHGVTGHSDLLRDSQNNSIVNIDSNGYDQYVMKRKARNQKNLKVQTIEEEVANIKKDINEIKSLLKEILNGPGQN